MADKFDALFDELFDAVQPRLRYWTALLGDGNGNVAVPGLVKRVYCRMPDGHPAIVFNDDKVPLTNDLPVAIGYDFINPQLLQILGLRQAYTGEEGGGYTTTIGAHHNTHEWLSDHGGNDVVFSDARQLMPDRLTPLVGLTVGVFNSPVYTDSGWVSAALSTLDLTPYVPATGAVYVLVTQGTDGLLHAHVGTNAPTKSMLLWSDIPNKPDGERELAAVALAAGQTTITETQATEDVVDLRFIQSIDTPYSHVGSVGNQHGLATTSNAGFMPALSGVATQFLNGVGGWSEVAAGGSTVEIATVRLDLAEGTTVIDLPDYAASIESFSIGGLLYDPLDWSLNDTGDQITLTSGLPANAVASATYILKVMG